MKMRHLNKTQICVISHPVSFRFWDIFRIGIFYKSDESRRRWCCKRRLWSREAFSSFVGARPVERMHDSWKMTRICKQQPQLLPSNHNLLVVVLNMVHHFRLVKQSIFAVKNWKFIHVVSGTGVRTHDLSINIYHLNHKNGSCLNIPLLFYRNPKWFTQSYRGTNSEKNFFNSWRKRP